MVVTKESRMQGKGIGGMSRRTAAWLAWSLWTVCVVLIALTLFLDLLTGEVFLWDPLAERSAPGFAVLTGVLSLAYPTVGALIACPATLSAGSSVAWDYSTQRSASVQRTPTTRCSRISRFQVGSTRPGSQRW